MNDLYRDLLVQILAESRMEVLFPDIHGEISGLVELRCLEALQKIKAIVEDDSLEDTECFMKIEKIVLTLEDIGSGGGLRHDF